MRSSNAVFLIYWSLRNLPPNFGIMIAGRKTKKNQIALKHNLDENSGRFGVGLIVKPQRTRREGTGLIAGFQQPSAHYQG